MAYSEAIRLGSLFDGDETLSTTLTYSDAIEANGKTASIQIEVIGDSGDGDDVEVFQYNSLTNVNGTFDTEGTELGTITLNEDNKVVKSFYIQACKVFKIGLKMVDASTETPKYKGTYIINDAIDNKYYG